MAGLRNNYHLWRQEILVKYPLVLYMPQQSPLPEIALWVKDVGMDCTWHISRFNVFDFQLGFDFFFQGSKDAAFFRLAWGGTPENYKPEQFHLFYFD